MKWGKKRKKTRYLIYLYSKNIANLEAFIQCITSSTNLLYSEEWINNKYIKSRYIHIFVFFHLFISYLTGSIWLEIQILILLLYAKVYKWWWFEFSELGLWYHISCDDWCVKLLSVLPKSDQWIAVKIFSHTYAKISFSIDMPRHTFCLLVWQLAKLQWAKI